MHHVKRQWRYKEGCDLPDDEYMKWLHEAHLGSMMMEKAATNENDTLGQSNNDGQITIEKSIMKVWRRIKFGWWIAHKLVTCVSPS